MRADRLVSILLMLQQRNQITAAEVASELEISQRTARRDLDALGVAGLPVYSVQGRHGGWRLAGGGKTDLSGLSSSEVRALFMVAGASSATTPELRTALRKLVRALPEQWRADAETAAHAVVIDPNGWSGMTTAKSTPVHLDAVQHAVIGGNQLRIGYIARDRQSSSRVVDPLGLAAKGSSWYLIADTEAGQRTFRIDRITTIEPTGQVVRRPDGFDLNDTWQAVADRVEELRSPVRARVLVDPDYMPMVRGMLGIRVRIAHAHHDGRVEVEVRGHNPWRIAAELAGFGSGVEVLEPREIRDHLARIGTELVARYKDRPPIPAADRSSTVRSSNG